MTRTQKKTIAEARALAIAACAQLQDLANLEGQELVDVLSACDEDLYQAHRMLDDLATKEAQRISP